MGTTTRIEPNRTTRDPIATEAEVCYRELSHVELADVVDWLRREAADPYGDVHRCLVTTRLRVAEAEQARRARLVATGRVAQAEMADTAVWRNLIEEVRTRTDLPALFDAAGYELRRAGRTEWCGPCLVCGGRDRFRVFTDPPGRYWCRRCNLTGDAITAARNLLPGQCPTFRRAVAYLAGLLGLPTPNASAASPRADTSLGLRRGPVPIRHGGRRGRR